MMRHERYIFDSCLHGLQSYWDVASCGNGTRRPGAVELGVGGLPKSKFVLLLHWLLVPDHFIDRLRLLAIICSVDHACRARAMMQMHDMSVKETSCLRLPDVGLMDMCLYKDQVLSGP